MAANPGDRTLTREQLDAAVAMLRDERAAHPVSPRQRRLLRWYEWAVWGFLAGLAAFVVLIARFENRPNPKFGWPEGLVGGAALLSLLAALVLFALNLKLLLQTAREVVIAVRSRLWRLTAPGAHRRTWVRRVLLVPKTYGWLLAAGALGGAAAAGWFGIVVAIVVAAYFFLWFARRRLARLDDAERLVQSLAGLQGGASPQGVGVPDAVFRKVAQIEDRRIERQRAEAMAGLAKGPTGYALVRSRRLVHQLQTVDDPTERLRIEHGIADLARVPARADVPEVETAAVPGSTCVLRFRRDAQALRIEVLELVGAAAGDRPAEEAAHDR